MPRFSNIKDTLIEFNNMNLQAETRYRESGLAHWPKVAVHDFKLNVSFEYIAWLGRNKFLNLEFSDSHQR